MTKEEFYKLSKEEQLIEFKRCDSLEYFYNNYCRKEGMPEFSEKVWRDYEEMVNNIRLSRNVIQTNIIIDNLFLANN